VPLLVAALFISGCQTASIDDLGVGQQSLITPTPLPVTKPVEPEIAAEEPNTPPTIAETETTSAAKTGVYPRIGDVPVGETRQLSEQRSAAIRRELQQKSTRSSRIGKGEKLTEYQKELRDLRKKARTHGKDALKKIEGPSG